MYGCSILVPHVEALHYLKFCIKQIRKYRHAGIAQEIIIADQSGATVYQAIKQLYNGDNSIQILHFPKVDHGHAIDMGLKAARYEYYCSLDCDAFPIHKNWLYLPIKLLEQYNLSFVGNNNAKELFYQEKGEFFHINDFYRVSRTDLAREISDTVGFLKYENRERVGFAPKDDAWGNSYADSGIIAQWYADQKKLGEKISLDISSYVGTTNKMGQYGLVVDDLVFHLMFGYGEDWIADLTETIGVEYLELRARMRREGLSEQLLKELIAGSVKLKNTRRINGQPVSPQMDAVIETIKNS